MMYARFFVNIFKKWSVEGKKPHFQINEVLIKKIWSHNNKKKERNEKENFLDSCWINACVCVCVWERYIYRESVCVEVILFPPSKSMITISFIDIVIILFWVIFSFFFC